MLSNKTAFPLRSQQLNLGRIKKCSFSKIRGQQLCWDLAMAKGQTESLCLLMLLWLTSYARLLRESRATSQRKECSDRFYGKTMRGTCCFNECLAFSTGWLFCLLAVWVAGWITDRLAIAWCCFLAILFSWAPCWLLKTSCLALLGSLINVWLEVWSG